MSAEELETAGLVGGAELGQELPTEQARENPHRQKEPFAARHPLGAVERDAAARHDHVDVRVMRHRRAPGVKHRPLYTLATAPRLRPHRDGSPPCFLSDISGWS